MKKKYILYSGVIFLTSIVIWFGINFRAGSYPYAEIYELNIDEAALIQYIQEFKVEHSEYNVPPELLLTDGRSDKYDHWYHIYFYYPIENQIIYAWTRPGEQGITKFALVSVNYGQKLGNWKDINKDFSSSENKIQKQKFEERILNNIKEKFSRR